VSLRCPYANSYRCPRYYQSRSLLGSAGITTEIDSPEDDELLKKWENSDLWPVTNEEATSTAGSSDRQPIIYSNFCPEVSGEIFGLFASSLCRYSDEIDRNNAHTIIERDGDSTRNNWRWEWANVSETHYRECEIYSQLSANLANQKIVMNPKVEEVKFTEASGKELITIKPGAFGVNFDLKELLSRASRWWLDRHGK